ncbi:MAG: pentapeptide repeat-containing protein [Candidatus Poribacteria bacterium]|nr:pentapeptide repeat-containing protein [Candidatus Poribacteria bacterium]
MRITASWLIALTVIVAGCSMTPKVGTREIDHEKLRYMDLVEADLRGANLEGVVLAERSLYKANLQNANLRNADLHRCDLGTANLRNADLSGADLRWANLIRADLRGANLENAIFSDGENMGNFGANLRRADLRKANLKGADMRGVTLEYADLRYADARGANFNGTDLAWAQTEWLKWSKATFVGARYVREQYFPTGLKPDEVGMVLRAGAGEAVGGLNSGGKGRMQAGTATNSPGPSYLDDVQTGRAE